MQTKLVRANRNEQKEMKLKEGDVVYSVHDTGSYVKFFKLIIVGPCLETDFNCPAYTAKTEHGERIRTCNSHIVKTISEVRKIAKEINKKHLEEYKKKQSNISKQIEYLQWIIQNPKRLNAETESYFGKKEDK